MDYQDLINLRDPTQEEDVNHWALAGIAVDKLMEALIVSRVGIVWSAVGTGVLMLAQQVRPWFSVATRELFDVPDLAIVGLFWILVMSPVAHTFAWVVHRDRGFIQASVEESVGWIVRSVLYVIMLGFMVVLGNMSKPFVGSFTQTFIVFWFLVVSYIECIVAFKALLGGSIRGFARRVVVFARRLARYSSKGIEDALRDLEGSRSDREERDRSDSS